MEALSAGAGTKDLRDDRRHLEWLISMRKKSTVRIKALDTRSLIVVASPMTTLPSPLGAEQEQPIETLVAVEGDRMAIEDSFETVKRSVINES